MRTSPCFGLTLLILASGALSLVACLRVEPPTRVPVSKQAAADLTAIAMGCGPMVLV